VNRKLFSLHLILAVLLFSCHQDKQKSNESAAFASYIQAFTSGVVSVESNIAVYLTNPLAPEDIAGKKLFRFNPVIDGKTVLVSDRIIEFQPLKPLKPGTEYSVDFELGEILNVDKTLQTLHFLFSTISPSFSVELGGLKNYGMLQPDQMQFNGTLLTADVMESEVVEELLHASFEGKEIKLNWDHAANSRKHNFTIDSLQRFPEKSAVLKLAWNGKVAGINEEGEKTIEVPAQNSFSILDAKVVNQPAQHVEIRFSDPLLRDQDLSGLVSLTDGNELRLEIDNNLIKCWPAVELTGEKQLQVFQGIKNISYHSLKNDENFLLQFSTLKPAIRLIGKGVIVPQNASLEMPFEAVSLSAMEVHVVQVYQNNILAFFQENQMNGGYELRKVGRLVYQGKIDLNRGNPEDLRRWNTYKIDLSKLFKIEQGAIYRVELRMKKEYSVYSCGGENVEEKTSAPELNPEEAYQTEWDNSDWYSTYYYPDGYNWRERDNPCHVSYFNSDRFVSRNIFASDLGIISKEGSDHKLHFIVTSLTTTQPEQGVKLSLYNYQNQLIDELETGNDGFASIQLKKKPYLLVAQKGSQFGYLRLDDGSALSTSNFNVAGAVVQEGVKGFIYGERGVWRPGDTLFLNFILKKESDNFPEDYPVIFQLKNPNGQIVERQVHTENTNGFYSFQPKTNAEAPTGNWTVEAHVGSAVFSKRVKIETVKPNRLKVQFTLPGEVLTTSDRSVKIKASWLHGAPAKSLKTKVDVLFAKDKTTFKGYEKFSFINPASYFAPEEQTIFDDRLSADGEATIPLTFQSLSNAPGMLKLWFTTRVFEEGGDLSINVTPAKYAPFKRFVGVKMPDSEDSWYKTDTDYLPEIVLVNDEGKPVSGGELEARLYKIDWRWWWESGDENLAHYVSGNYYEPVQKWKIENASQLNKLKLNVKYRSWQDNGRYFLYVKDTEGGHAAGLTFYMSKWGGWRSDDAPDAATILTLQTDKEKYKVGDQIEVRIPSSKKGKALVSIENGTEVADLFWVNTEETQTTFYLEAKPEMAPNFFVHVSLIQPYGQTENDAPLRLYGVIPVLVEDPSTRLKPKIDAPKEIEPEKEFTVKVSEENRRKMTYTLAIVDEGLLGLTNFRTPSPHAVFYAREALGVKTWDLYDDVAGAYGARLEKAFAVGGDDEMQNAGKKEVNRFKPVVLYTGPFTVEKGKSNEHRFTMPNYIGSVRMMVVAADDAAFGDTETEVPVRKGLMLLATLPRVLAPGETVKLPVDVFAMKEEVRNVQISVESNNLLEITGDETQSLQFETTGEKMAYFNLKVNENTGVAKVKIKAKSGSETATYDVELEVRNPNSSVIKEDSKIVEAGSEWQTTLTAPGQTDGQEAWVEISAFPSLDVSKQLDYLITYPHGCIEQVTSAAFPQLFLGKLMELTNDQKLDTEDNVKIALNKLISYQTSDGGFAYWPGGRSANEWGTCYAGHFMFSAEKAGYTLPAGLKEKWLNYQKTAARNWNSQRKENAGLNMRYADLTQAYRLYTMALAGSPDLGAMNRLREITNKSNEISWRLAAAYVLAGQNEAARQIANGISTHVEEYTEMGGIFGSSLRDKAMILESLVLLKENKKAFELLQNMADEVNKRDWLSTQTAAWSLLAAARFADSFHSSDSEMNFELLTNGKSSSFRTKMPLVKIPVQPDNSGQINVSFQNKSKGVNYVKVLAKGIPTGIDSTKISNNLLMKVRYLDANKQEIDPAKMQQGEDLSLEVTVKHPGVRAAYTEMVLSTVFPSGWEIRNRRLNDIPDASPSGFDYQDIRDDRVYTYFDLNPGQQKTFVFQLNASYAGEFYLSPVKCEAMYDYSVRAQVPGKMVEVKAPESK